MCEVRSPLLAVQAECRRFARLQSQLPRMHTRGTTLAFEDRSGAFEQAHQGTLFLDEVGELPLDVQPKLLQALESNRVRPLGSATEVDAEVRIMAATNRSLEDGLRSRTFRADLYHRLNVVRIEIPALRERKEDIAPLVDQVGRKRRRVKQPDKRPSSPCCGSPWRHGY